MNYDKMKEIVEAVKELKALSFNTLEEAKAWAKHNCSNVWSLEQPDFFDFDYKMLTGTFYERDNGQIELCENLTAYDENDEPFLDIEL